VSSGRNTTKQRREQRKRARQKLENIGERVFVDLRPTEREVRRRLFGDGPPREKDLGKDMYRVAAEMLESERPWE